MSLTLKDTFPSLKIQRLRSYLRPLLHRMGEAPEYSHLMIRLELIGLKSLWLPLSTHDYTYSLIILKINIYDDNVAHRRETPNL